MKLRIKIYILFGCATLLACKKLIEIPVPENQVTVSQVFDDSVSVLAALANTYAGFEKTADPATNKFLGLYADELYFPSASSADAVEMAQSKLSTLNALNLSTWRNYYFLIYQCNSIIENTNSADKLSAGFAALVNAEAKCLRAMAYLHLSALYGKVPLLLGTNVELNRQASRTETNALMELVEKDLISAYSNLPEVYRGKGRVRMNRWCAAALLSKLYAIQRKWSNVEQQASLVIASAQYVLEPLNNIFLSNSREVILQFWTQNGFISDATALIPTSGAPGYPLTPGFMIAFENGDARKTSWIKTSIVGANTFYSPYKYKNRTTNTTTPEYLVALRLADIYLLRAEARVQQNKLLEGTADLNLVRTRAGLPASAAVGQTDLLTAIYKERRIELFAEYGNRFFDLQRWGQLNTVIGSLKPTWKKDTAVVWPIPQNEITYNRFLEQNPGY